MNYKACIQLARSKNRCLRVADLLSRSAIYMIGLVLSYIATFYLGVNVLLAVTAAAVVIRITIWLYTVYVFNCLVLKAMDETQKG